MRETKRTNRSTASQSQLDAQLAASVGTALSELREADSSASVGELAWPLIKCLTQPLSPERQLASLKDVQAVCDDVSRPASKLAATFLYHLRELTAAIGRPDEAQRLVGLEHAADVVGAKDPDPRTMLEGVLFHLARATVNETGDLRILRPFLFTGSSKLLGDLVNFLGNCGAESVTHRQLQSGALAGPETTRQAEELLNLVLEEEAQAAEHDHVRAQLARFATELDD